MVWVEAIERLGGVAMQPAALWTALIGALLALLRQKRLERAERLRARRRQVEMMAYTLLEDWRVVDERAMGRRMCRAIAHHSAFGCAALLVRDAGGRLRIRASQRTDDLTVRALERWAEAEQERGGDHRGEMDSPGAGRVAQLVRLERRSGYQPGDPAALAWCTALLVPMCNRRGHMIGVIAVCADRFRGRPRASLEAALEPVQVLAMRFADRMAPIPQDPQSTVAAAPAEADSAGGEREPMAMQRGRAGVGDLRAKVMAAL